MNIFEVQDLFRNMYPEKKVSFEFDEKCHRYHELVYTDGKPNPVHHVDNNKVKVTVEGMEPKYVDIDSHRENYTWDAMKDLLKKKMGL